MAFDGSKIADNPKCIYDYLIKHHQNQWKYIWVYNGEKDEFDFPADVDVVKRYTLKWFCFMATSKVIVDNYPPSIVIPSRKRQLYLETWHAGGAYKKIGGAHANSKTVKNTANKKMSNVDVFVSSSRGFTRGNIEEGYQYTGEILNCGMPRNDIFFENKLVEEAANKVKRYFTLQGVVVLYAPTFRGSAYKPIEINDIINQEKLQSILKIKFEANVDILVRLHPLDHHNYNFGKDVIDVGDYPDMQELLCASDILITDYSSCMWDFAILGRPCLLYMPDIDQYIRDRGFFTPPEQWPGIICRNMDELCDEIINLDEEDCAAKAKRYLELMGSYETGHATEIIANRIVDYMNGD